LKVSSFNWPGFLSNWLGVILSYISIVNMRGIIHRHNRLNGVAFSIIEFTFISLFVGGFGTYYLVHRNALIATIAWGITLNCLPVVVIGLRQLRHDRAINRPVPSFWDRKTRERFKLENPHMFRETMILTTVALLPFIMLAAVLLDRPRPAKR
jgi:hypothetical protein